MRCYFSRLQVGGGRIAERPIREAAEKGIGTKVESVAHQLKGASASFGLNDFSARMKEAEYAAKEGRGLEEIATEAWFNEATQLLERAVASVRCQSRHHNIDESKQAKALQLVVD